MMKPINVVIVGRGMYVCGRGTDGYGIICPAILEWSRSNDIGDVYIVGTKRSGMRLAKNKIDELKHRMKVSVSVKYFPQGVAEDRECYEEAIKNIRHPAVCIVAVPDNLHKDVASCAIKNGL